MITLQCRDEARKVTEAAERERVAALKKAAAEAEARCGRVHFAIVCSYVAANQNRHLWVFGILPARTLQ
jgi:hypothetical protein